MASLNRCEFIGNLGKDPEIRYAPSGDAVASFSIACSDKWKDKKTGENVERTEWINVTAFGKLGEIIGKYLKKGSKVFISGKMNTDKYEKDGVTKYSTKIIAREMIMLDGKGDKPEANDSQNQSSVPANQVAQQSVIDPNFDDDIPF